MNERREPEPQPTDELKMLQTLPVAFLCGLLGSWINLKSLVYLDIAHCNEPDRLALTSLLSSHSYVFRNSVTFCKPELVTWLSIKKIKVSKVVLKPYINLELLSDYLRTSGPAISALRIWSGQKTNEMYTIAIHCKNLQILECDGIQLDAAFKEVLWSNPNLSEIWLNGVNCNCTAMFDKVPLNKLHTLSIRNSTCSRKNLTLSGVTSNNALKKLRLGWSLGSEVVVQFAQTSPELLSLSLKDAQLPNETLIEVCSVLPNLLHLDISNNRKLNSEGACQMFEKLKKLRSINIQTCTTMGDGSINSLATHCGSTLEVVYMSVQNVNAPSTVDALHMFGEHCPKLHYLSLHCYRNVLCLAGGTFALLQGLPALRTLVVESAEVISVSSREFLKIMRPQLQIEVEHAVKHVYNALSMPI